MKENEPKHIGDSNRWHIQEIQWDKIPIGRIIKFEIVNFWKMRNKEGWKDMWYCEFVAKMGTQIGSFCLPSDLVIMDLPYKSFERAIGAVPKNKKRFISEKGKYNVYMEIEKRSKRSLIISRVEQRVEDIDLTLKAKEMLYDYV